MTCSLTTRRTSCEFGEWIQGDLICKGAWGSVFKAYPVKLVEGIPAIMAVKVVEVSEPKKLTPLINEGQMLSEFQDCPFVIKYYGHEWTCNSDKKPVCLNLLLEYAAGGTLGDRIGKAGLVESQVKDFTVSILKGIRFIHERGYVHGDIKPDNILLVPQVTSGSSEDNLVPKLADFGGAKRYWDEDYRLGSLKHSPPETVFRQIQGTPADIWALGCVVLEMLTGMPLPLETIEDIVRWVSNPIIPANLSEEAKDFLAKCLDKNASNRFTARMLLTHSFLTKPRNINEQASVRIMLE